MKSLKLAVLAFACLMTPACAAIGPAVAVFGSISPSVHATGDKVILNGTRALILANNAYQGAALSVAPFVAAKRFTPSDVNRIEKLNDRALQLLQEGDAGMTVAQRAAGVFAIADELTRLTGK